MNTDILLTILDIVIGTGVGAFITYFIMRFFGKFYVSGIVKSLTRNVNEKQPIFRVEFHSLEDIQLNLSVPKLINSIKKLYKKE